ncbi:MAG: hypothetical protein QMB63_01640 [Clostridiaceae bacterium]
MFIIFGLAAIFFAILNIISFIGGRETKWYRFISMALSLLTTGFIYQSDADYVVKSDFNALADVVPGTSRILWICIIASILLNGITLFSKPKEKDN